MTEYLILLYRNDGIIYLQNTRTLIMFILLNYIFNERLIRPVFTLIRNTDFKSVYYNCTRYLALKIIRLNRTARNFIQIPFHKIILIYLNTISVLSTILLHNSDNKTTYSYQNIFQHYPSSLIFLNIFFIHNQGPKNNYPFTISIKFVRREISTNKRNTLVR